VKKFKNISPSFPHVEDNKNTTLFAEKKQLSGIRQSPQTSEFGLFSHIPFLSLPTVT